MMISLSEAWFFTMRAFGLDPVCSAFPMEAYGGTYRAESALRLMLMTGEVMGEHMVDGCPQPILLQQWRRGYRLEYCDNTMVPTGSVLDLPVLTDVRVCGETVSRRLSILSPQPPPSKKKVVTKGGRRPKLNFEDLRVAFKLRCKELGELDEDAGPEGWKIQADVERWVRDFSKDKGQEVCESTSREYASLLMTKEAGN